jgi:hypothetical protein
MYTLLIILALATVGYMITIVAWNAFLKHVLERWEDTIQAQIPPVPSKVKFLGGPYDGRVDLIHEDKKKPFFIAPYVPNEEEDRGEVFGVINGIPMHKPNLAYYREVTDEEYFYVRDITHEEYGFLVETGQPPAV